MRNSLVQGSDRPAGLLRGKRLATLLFYRPAGGGGMATRRGRRTGRLAERIASPFSALSEGRRGAAGGRLDQFKQPRHTEQSVRPPTDRPREAAGHALLTWRPAPGRE